MGFIYTRIRQAIITLAEAEDDVTKIGYGEPTGARINIEDIGWFERGKAWLFDKTGGETKGFLDFLVESTANELERGAEHSCRFDVSASDVLPAALYSDGIVAVKHENGIPPAGTCDYVDFILSNSYVSGSSYSIFVNINDGNFVGSFVVSRPAPTIVRVTSATDLNSTLISVLCKGASA